LENFRKNADSFSHWRIGTWWGNFRFSCQVNKYMLILILCNCLLLCTAPSRSISKTPVHCLLIFNDLLKRRPWWTSSSLLHNIFKHKIWRQQILFAVIILSNFPTSIPFIEGAQEGRSWSDWCEGRRGAWPWALLRSNLIYGCIAEFTKGQSNFSDWVWCCNDVINN
jgi:hypothetical protein